MNRHALLMSTVVALLGGILLAVYVRQFQREASGGDPISLLALRQDVGSGVPLTEAMLVVRTLPEKYVEDRQVLASDVSKALGVKTSIGLEANQTLLWTDLATTPQHRKSLSSRIPKGMRAMSVAEAGGRAFADLMRPGDRVDVLLTRAKPGPEPKVVTVPLLQNILVLAIGNNFDRATHERGQRGSDSATLLLSIDQASLLAQARRSGTLNLALRNEHDLAINGGLPETDDSDVLTWEKRIQRQSRLRLERVD